MYDKLVETAKAQAAVVSPEEESDMEASDVEDDVPNVNSDSLPLGTTFRTIHLLQQAQPQDQGHHEHVGRLPSGSGGFVPRKLSTISSQDRESVQIPEIEEEPEDNELAKTTEAEVHAKLLNTTDFEWHPENELEEPRDPESEALLSPSSADAEKSDSAAGAPGAEPSETLQKKPPSRYKNTHV